MSHVLANRVLKCFYQHGLRLFGKTSYSPLTFKILIPHILPSLTLRTNAPTMSDACAMNAEFDYVSPVPEDQYNAVIVHLRNNFFADEPLNKAIGLFQHSETSPDLESFCLSTLKKNMSIMAVNKGTRECVGVCLNHVLLPGDIQQEKKNLKNISDKKFKKILTLLTNSNEPLDLFNKYKVDKIFEIVIISTDSNYRGKGLATSLAKKSEDIAREKNCKMAKADATGIFSQKMFTSLGFESVYELKYADYVDKNGEQIFKTEAPHVSLKVMVKRLE